MSSQESAPARGATNTVDSPKSVSRRRLLQSSAAVAAVATLPVLAREGLPDGRERADHPPREQRTDEQRRLAAVLDVYGPELGEGR